MKHLDDYENLLKKKIDITETDLNNIEKILFDKMKEHKIEPNIDNIYYELDILKKDRKNSLIYSIIKKYFNIYSIDENDRKEQAYNKQTAIKTAIKFFELKYGDIIRQYKLDKKKEFEIESEKIKNYIYLPFEGNLIKVPERIGHNYIPLKILPMEDLHTKYSRHKRLKTFHTKGLKCVSCPREGEYLIAAKDNGGQIHLDIYTKEFELMTVDHIKPKSKGGSYDIENLDPMCSFCNTEKSDKYDEIETPD